MSKAVFLGSFDPPHYGHRDVLEAVIKSGVMDRCNIDKIHVIVAKQNPNKPESTDYDLRFRMCIAMFWDLHDVLVDNIEEKVQPKYTYDLFKMFHQNKDNVIKSDFKWIITTETINELIHEKWYKSKTLLCENKFIAVVNNDAEIKQIKNAINWDKGQVNFVKMNSTHNVHSSAIRKGVKEGNYDILNNTKESVKLIITDNKLYR